MLIGMGYVQANDAFMGHGVHSDRKSIYDYEAHPTIPSLFRAKYKVRDELLTQRLYTCNLILL